MNKKTILSCALATSKNVRNLRGASLAAALIVTLAITAVTATLGLSIFRSFTDDSGLIQSAPSRVTISTSLGSVIPVNGPLDATNKFFNANFGTNGQACVTCHQPAEGFTIHVNFINNTFAASNGTNPLFRPNDTANNPSVTTVSADDYSLFLNLGVIRIGKTFGVTPPADCPQFLGGRRRPGHHYPLCFTGRLSAHNRSAAAVRCWRFSRTSHALAIPASAG